MVLDITADLIEGTPVDLGWAQANWVPGVGRTIPKDPTGFRDDFSSVDQSAGIAEVIGMSPGEDSFIANNVPYITELNEGSSSKAEAGYVDAIIIDRVGQANGKVLD